MQNDLHPLITIFYTKYNEALNICHEHADFLQKSCRRVVCGVKRSLPQASYAGDNKAVGQHDGGVHMLGGDVPIHRQAQRQPPNNRARVGFPTDTGGW